jgi:YD repeat-containing protein
VNGDGLVDVVTSHGFGGQLLLNTGTAWKDPFGYKDYNSFHNALIKAPTSWPVVPQAGDSSIDSNGAFLAGPADGYAPPFTGFIDINGDGLADRLEDMISCHYRDPGNGVCDAQSTLPTIHDQMAKLNAWKRPVINEFPNGRAKWTFVTYAQITTADAVSQGIYADSNQLAPGTTYSPVPMEVVSAIDQDDGVGGTTARTSYQYSDFRGSTFGPQGFRQIAVTDPVGMVTTTTYAQAYPYTGMPVSVTREQKASVSKTEAKYCDDAKTTQDPTTCTEQSVLISKTETHYCDNTAAAGDLSKCTPITGTSASTMGKEVFVYPLVVTDTSYLRGSEMATPGSDDDKVTTTTRYVYDNSGNPTNTTVTTASSWDAKSYERKIDNTYETADEKQLGKPSQTVVNTREMASGKTTSTTTHTTGFEYGSSPTFALLKKKIEPGKGVGIELHTAYDYDEYGNLITTTSCATDFDYCEAGGDSGGDPSQPDHLPFRTTWVSYKIADRDPAPASVGGVVPAFNYQDGRFPVRTMNALNQIQYSAYDPLLGVLIQSKGPNGIHTCYEYDSLGYQQSETAHCGVTGYEVKTTTARYLAPFVGSAPALAKTLVVTQPQGGPATGVYADALGRQIETVSQEFEGRLIHTSSKYDALGRVQQVSKPFFEGAASQYWTTTTYDWLGRPKTVTQDLGVIETGKSPASNVTTMTYVGAMTQTEQTVNGETRNRYEWKNMSGKIATVQDALGNEVLYTYDPEGNLTDTNSLLAGATGAGTKLVHIDYDILGRKSQTIDADLGTWTYGHNGFGELVSQTDAKQQITTMTYDELGRMTTKTDATGTAEWVYDIASGAGIGKVAAMVSAPDSKLNAPCTVPNTTQTDGNRAGRSFTYDGFGNVQEVTECADGESFVTTYDYDQLGRQKQVTYPEVNDGSRFAVEYHYTSLGFLQYVADGTDHKPYWVATGSDESGQISGEQTRNGVRTDLNRNPSTGWLLGSTTVAYADNVNLIQDLAFSYDETGNLRSRALR